MCVLESSFLTVFQRGPFYSVQIDNRLTGHSPAFDQMRGLVRDCNVFPVLRKRDEVAVTASHNEDDVVSVSGIGFGVPLSLHFLLQDSLIH